MALLLRFPWRALHWFDWILLVVIKREEYFCLLDYSMLSARFPSSQYPNHHFGLLLEQRNVGTCCPPWAGTPCHFPQGRTCPWSRCPGKLSPFSSHHCCLLAACSRVHTARGKHLPMGMCIHNSFPPPAAKLLHSKAGMKQQPHSWKLFFLLKVTVIFWESQSTPWFLVEVKSI